jgi:hypothetical protein
LIDLLVLDRGFYGAAFLRALQETYGLKFLVPVPDNAHAGIWQIDQKEEQKQPADWVNGTIPASRRKDGELAVRVTTVESLAVVDDETGEGFLANGVLQYSERKKDGPFRLLTNAPLEASKPARGLSFVRHYQKRFGGAENKGVRELNHRTHRVRSGRSRRRWVGSATRSTRGS